MSNPNCSRCDKQMRVFDPLSDSQMDICYGCAQEIGIYSLDELIELSRNLDNHSEWMTVDEFYDVWNPRHGRNRDRIRKLIMTALRGALRGATVKTIEVPDRGNTAAEPVRAFVEGDVLVQEFRIVGGPRKGEILTMRTRMVP